MEFIKKITQRELFKIASLNSLSVFLRIVTGYVSSKIIAVFVGPAGIALVGNFRNFLNSVETLGTLGFQNGIIKYVAEHEKEHFQLKRTISTVVMILVPIVILLSISFWFFSDELSSFLFEGQTHFRQIFVYLAIAFPFYVSSIILTAILNGFSQFKKVVLLNVVGNLLGVVGSILLVITLRTEGALISLFLTPALLCFVTLFFLKNHYGLIEFKREFFDVSILKSFFEYSLMALTASIFGPLVNVLIRKKLMFDLGIENAGYWEAMNRISDFYFLFLSTLLTVYFLPQLSKANAKEETQMVFKKYYQNVIPLFSFGLIAIYVLREFIVRLLLAKTFLPVMDLFFWRMMGDFFKALSLILGYQLLAKKMTNAFIVTELFSLGLLFVINLLLIPKYGLQGAVMAHAVEYFIYFVTLTFYFKNK